jgi:hypothetical protein
MNLTIGTLLLAIRSVESEIKKYKIMTQDENASDEELDDYGDYVLELSQAHEELGLGLRRGTKGLSAISVI